MNTWLQICEDARQMMRSTASMLLDKQCSELFDIVEVLSRMAEEACDKDSGAVGCGMCAAYYRLAGTGKNIADFAMQALTAADKLDANSAGDSTIPEAWQQMQKVRGHQDAVRDFAAALQDDCRNDLMHLTSEIDVMLEHPFVVADDAFRICLQAQHDALEEYVEWFYETGDQLFAHPVLSIAMPQ